MPQPISSREDIKKDALQEWTKTFLEWISHNRQTFFSIVGIVVAVTVISIYVITSFKNLRKQAWEKYSAGQNLLYSNNHQNAVNAFNDVITNYARTPAATYSILAIADLLYQQKDYTAAIENYKKCLDRDPEWIILPFILSGLGAAQEDSGDYQASIETYKEFTSKFPDHFLTPNVYDSLGRVYELSRNDNAAKETYEKIITMFPESLWSQKARVRYEKISPQPFQLNAPAKSAP